MMDDGSFISGGKDDGALVIFNERYELIGAGAVLPKRSENDVTVLFVCLSLFLTYEQFLNLF